jgi:hypothetical protein
VKVERNGPRGQPLQNASMLNKSSRKKDEKAKKLNPYPARCMRFWHGMRVRDYTRMMFRNRFRVHPKWWGMIFTVGLATVVNSTLHRIQRLFLGRKLDATAIDKPPVFIIGHWRSGTTFMHELMVRDEQFAYSTTYECFAPYHFILTESFMPKLLWFTVPPKRPMDNMATGFDHPQEDEFALCAMGSPTPYFKMAFPNHPPVYMDSLDMESVSKEDKEHFSESMMTFVRALTYRHRKRLVLKSPPHTGRIELLSKLFPGAKFIHIVRHPYSLVPSTRRTWEALDRAQGFQVPRHEHLNEFIFECYERMYNGFEQQRSKIPADNICDVRYEDFVKDPVTQLESIYNKLDLGDFEPVRQNLSEYLESQRDYKTNRHELDPELRAEIDRRWADYMKKYGYLDETATDVPS